MLLEVVRRACLAQRALVSGRVVVVGVSGGPDSLALLHSLHTLSPEIGFRLHVAHLNHLLRGEAAAEDARFVRDFAARLALPVTVGERDVLALHREHGLGVEEAARLARYQFFAEVVRAAGAAGVAVGHTADDQVETVVLHFLRGSGLAGLCGMRPASVLRVRSAGETTALRVFRPLLEAPRASVEAYCREHELHPRLDASNVEPGFRRNRVRRFLIPALEEYNPRFRQAALRLAASAAADEEYLQAETQRVWSRVAREEDGVVLSRAAWRELPRSLRARVLREAYHRLAGDLVGLEAAHVEAASAALEAKSSGATVVWPRGLRLTVGYDEVRIAPEPGPRPLPTSGVALRVPGVTPLAGTGRAIVARLQAQPCPWRRADAAHADVDFAAVGQPLTVRYRAPGDRLVPLGLAASKKLQDVLVDAKVPRAERDRVPLVTSGPDIVWVAGVRLDGRFKVTPSTRQVLCLRLEPGPRPPGSAESRGAGEDDRSGAHHRSEGNRNSEECRQ